MIRIRKGDILLFAVVITIGVFSLGYSTLFAPDAPPGNQAVVEVEGKTIQTYSLDDQEGIIRIDSTEGYNLLEFHDGRVRVKEASCPDQVCIHFGWVQQEGQIIVCMPHRLIVWVIDPTSDEEGLDGVTF